MDVYKVDGGRRLSGEVSAQGAKNAILPILAACILSNKPVELTNCPDISDVDNMLSILDCIGCRTQKFEDRVIVDASDANCCEIPQELSKRLRSSFFVLGPMIARFGKASCWHPGGCEIGNRPIDLHINGLKRINVDIAEGFGQIKCRGDNLIGADVHLDYPSVGATENIMMAAVRAEGVTVIYNAAREPEIVDLQRFLNEIGFHVAGAGSSMIAIKGGGVTHETTHRIIPDRIVTGTLLCAGVMCGGDIIVKEVEENDVSAIVSKLSETGCSITSDHNSIRLRANRRPGEIRLIETSPYPGFPTDMQSLMFSTCSVADGTSVIVENVFDSRFKHVAEMAKMGAIYTIKDRIAVIRGVPKLTGAEVCAKELRGGAALTIAAIAAEGESTIHGVEYIDRGYDKLECMLRSFGASIRRETV